jgi:hypothetical protein
MLSWAKDGSIFLCDSLLDIQPGLPGLYIYKFHPVQQQKAADCGCFAIAFAVSAAF